MPCSCFCSPTSFINLWKSCSLQIQEVAYLGGLMSLHSNADVLEILGFFVPLPSILSLPVLIPPGWDRSARLFLSIGVDRVLCIPCQLWLVGRTAGEEALTASDRSRRRPGPVHHLSAHAYWVPDSPFSAVYHTGQLPTPSVCSFFFTLSKPMGNFFGRVETILLHLTGLFHGWKEQKHSLFTNRRYVQDKGKSWSQPENRDMQAFIFLVGYCGALVLWHCWSSYTFTTISVW